MIWLVDWSRVLGTAAESWKARRVTPRFSQKTDGRCDAQEGQSENVTEGLSQRRRGSREASLDVKDRDESTGSDDEASLDGKNQDEPTGNVDEVTPDVEIGMSGQLVSTIVKGHLQR